MVFTRTPAAAHSVAADPVSNAQYRFRIAAQPVGPDYRQRLTNGARMYFVLETGRFFEDDDLPAAIMSDPHDIIVNADDALFGTVYKEAAVALQ